MVEIPMVCETEAAGLGFLGVVITPWPKAVKQKNSNPNAIAFRIKVVLSMMIILVN